MITPNDRRDELIKNLKYWAKVERFDHIADEILSRDQAIRDERDELKALNVKAWETRIKIDAEHRRVLERILYNIADCSNIDEVTCIITAELGSAEERKT